MLINDFEYYNRSKNYYGKTSGLDHPLNSWRTTEDWHAYPIQDFDYRFNSWGFRGRDYEKYIGQKVNICLGDSFTVNLGGPIEHSWCSQLAERFDIPTLNLGMDGAGNDAIAILYRRACKLFDVQNSFVMYSFIHRRLNKKMKFIQGGDDIYANSDYFLKQRLLGIHETALPDWCWTPNELSFLKHCKIYFYSNMEDKQIRKTIERNRDGFHCSKKINKIYADYFFNQWKQKNES